MKMGERESLKRPVTFLLFPQKYKAIPKGLELKSSP